MLLLDTSAWVEYLRATGSPADNEVARLMRKKRPEVATTPPIVMELLAGAPSSSALLSLETLTNGLPSLELDVRQDFHAAAAVFRATRAVGATVRSLQDCLIAVIAHRHDVALLHRDRDFDVLATVLPRLKVISLL